MGAHIDILGSGPATPLTMSSREIAEITGKRHDNVRAGIAKMATELSLNFQEKVEASEVGRPSIVYMLPKRECLILVSGYSVELRARIIDRWMELEAAKQFDFSAVLESPAAMRGLLLTYTEKVMKLEDTVQRLEPKANAFDKLADTSGSFNRTNAAKMLGIAPHALIHWMRTHGWTYRRVGCSDDIAYQSKIAAGVLEHKISTGPRSDGSEWSSTQVRVTPKGMTVLAAAFQRKLDLPEPMGA